MILSYNARQFHAQAMYLTFCVRFMVTFGRLRSVLVSPCIPCKRTTTPNKMGPLQDLMTCNLCTILVVHKCSGASGAGVLQ